MTCIATDGRTMAGDGRITGDKTLLLSDDFTKVFVLDDGRVFGGTGLAHSIVNARDWLNAGAPGGDDRPEIDKESFEGLILDSDGAVFWFDESCALVPYSPPVAIGVGADAALAILREGRSPVEAVKAAARVHVTVGGKITVARPKRPRSI